MFLRCVTTGQVGVSIVMLKETGRVTRGQKCVSIVNVTREQRIFSVGSVKTGDGCASLSINTRDWEACM